MSYSIRRFDGRILSGLAAGEVFSQCQRGDLWPDEELRSDGAAAVVWNPLSSFGKLAPALAQGKAVRESSAVVHPEQLASENSAAVVQIVCPSGSSGSGFTIDGAGTVVTNEHVVSDATVCRVRLHSGLESAARVLHRSDTLDLAVVKCALPTARHIDPNVRRPASVRQGARAFVLGYPGHVDAFSMTQGLVSALNVARSGKQWHQISAPVNPGNSGGAVLGERGELIGIPTQRADLHADGRHAEGISWAIPFEDVCGFLRQFWGEVEAGRIRIPSAIDLVRECNRPDPAHELQLAVRRLVRDRGFRVIEVDHFTEGPLRRASLVGPRGEGLVVVIDHYPLGTRERPGPHYVFMYSALGEFPAEAAASASFHARILGLNMTLPHWQFAESEGQLVLRYCRQAELLDATEVLNVVDDLVATLGWLAEER